MTFQHIPDLFQYYVHLIPKVFTLKFMVLLVHQGYRTGVCSHQWIFGSSLSSSVKSKRNSSSGEV